MGPVAYFSLCLLGCLIFNPSLEGVRAASCPNDWLSYQGHCYAYFAGKRTWHDAEVQCQYHRPGAHLASILGEAEAQRLAWYVSKARLNTDFWIGLHDPQQNRRFRWSDGSRFGYRAWNAKEPNNQRGKEYCVQLLRKSGYKNWNDKNCSTKNAYVCKYRL